MPMIEFKNNAQLDAEEAALLEAEKEARERQNRPVITSLAAYVRSCWEAAKEAKQPIEESLIASLRQRKGEYPPDKLRTIRDQGGSEIFMMLTDEKCSAVTSWLSDILFPGTDKPWGIAPTPVPDLTQEQTQKIKQAVLAEAQGRAKQELIGMIQAGQITDQAQAAQFMLEAMNTRFDEMAGEIREQMESAAKEARDRVETKLHDVVVESGWEAAVHDALDDIVTFKAGIVKGPVLRRKKQMKWKSRTQPSPDGMDAGFAPQSASVEVVDVVSIDFNRVSPFDVYPLPGARTPQDGIIERHRLTRKFLTSLIGVKGYDDEAIQMVLKDYGSSGQTDWLAVPGDFIRQDLEDRPNEWRSPEPLIDALQFWGNVQGLTLLQYGMSPEEIEDPFNDYSVEVWLIGSYVIKAEVNGDPLGRVPYNFASFRKRNGSIWGAGVPEVIKDAQDACNAAARALINNMGISSGPQVMIDVAQLPAGENITDLYPWKLWQVNRNPAFGAGASSRPVDFFVPPSISSELMNIYQFFSGEADNKTGVPKYSYGGSQPSGAGALGTATGFSMMMSNATRGIKNVVRNIDNGIIKPSIERTHEFQLLFFNDPEYYQGDIKIIARGTTAMVVKETEALRRNELLQVVVGSPVVLDIIGKAGLASMLHEIFKAANFKDDEIVPDKQAMMDREQQEQMIMMQQQQAAIAEQSGEPPQKRLDQQTNPAGEKAGGRDVRTV